MKAAEVLRRLKSDGATIFSNADAVRTIESALQMLADRQAVLDRPQPRMTPYQREKHEERKAKKRAYAAVRKSIKKQAESRGLSVDEYEEEQRREQARKTQESFRRLSEEFDLVSKKSALLDRILDQWRLPDSTRLGDATKDQLAHCSYAERNQAIAHAQNADFYERLAFLLPSGRMVRDCVSDENVAALCIETWGNRSAANAEALAA